MGIRTRPAATLVAAVFFFIWGLLTHGTHAGSGDEPHYLIIAHSLAFDRDLDLDNNYREASLITADTLRPELHARYQDGRLRPVHDIGMPLLFAPAVRVAYRAAEVLGDRVPSTWLRAVRLNEGLLFRHQISLLMAILTALLARELFLLFQDISGRRWHACLWALLFTLSPPILSHGFLFFTEIPTALVVTLVFRRLAMRPVQSPWAGALMGLLAGALVLVHVRNVGLVAGLAALAALAAWGRRIPPGTAGAFIAGVVAGVAGRAAVTYALWGTVIATPFATVGDPLPLTATAREMFIRLSGLLFDREHGLFAYAPLYLLAVAGVFLAARVRRRLATDLGLVLVAYLVPILLPQLNVHGWRGGWSPAARFLVPIAPLLCIAAYYCVLASRHRLVLGLAAVQVGINLYVWQFPKTLWNDGDGTTAFGPARWLPSWSDPSGADAFRFALALCILLALGYAGARLASRSEPRAFLR